MIALLYSYTDFDSSIFMNLCRNTCFIFIPCVIWDQKWIGCYKIDNESVDLSDRSSDALINIWLNT